MSRFSESPSPQHGAPEDVGYDDRWIGRSRSPGPRGGARGRGAYLPPRSRSRSMPLSEPDAPPPERRRRRKHGDQPPQDQQGGPPPRQRGDERRRERPRPTRHGDAGGLDAPRGGRERGGREEGHGRQRDRGARQMAEAQKAMMRSMAQGMMGMGGMGGMGQMGNPAAMQMAMMQGMGQMGMMHPGYMQAMQQQQQQMMLGKRKKAAKKAAAGAGDSDGSSSDSSSDSDGPPAMPGMPGMPPGMDPRAAMAAMMAAQQQQQPMWPSAPSAPTNTSYPQDTWVCGECNFKNRPSNRICGGGGSMGCKAPYENRARPTAPPPPPPPPMGGAAAEGEEDVEAFLAANSVSKQAGDRLRALAPHLRDHVIRRGSPAETRNGSETLINWVKDAEMGISPMNGALSGGRQDARVQSGRGAAKAQIEKMIEDYRLDIACAWTMRALAPDKQRLAARIDPSGQADPSGYVAEELKRIV